MQTSIEQIIPWLEAAYYIAAMLGIPIGIILFVKQKRRERMAEELEAYHRTYDRYLVFLQEIIARPELRCGEFLDSDPELTGSGFTAQEISLFELLTMTMEQTFIVHSYARMTKNHPMWDTWDNYNVWWASREDFRKAWKIIDGWYYPPFKEYMTRLIAEAEIESEQDAPSNR